MTARLERDIFREFKSGPGLNLHLPSSSSDSCGSALILGMDERAFFPFSPSDNYAFLIDNMGGMSALEMYATAKRINGAPFISMIT